MVVINNRPIGGDNPTYIIAEMGINYNGSLDIALKMVEEAAMSGVDAVKLQIITADKSYAKGSNSRSIFKGVELELREWGIIVDKAKNLGIDVFSTFVNPYDLEYARKLDLPAIKISSTNLTNFPLLEAIATLKKPVIMSTGMSYISEVDEAVRFLEERNQKQIGILQCTALYPTPAKDVNLRSIETLSKAFPMYPVGFSDHTLGINCAIASVTMGAKIIEKHFTLDQKMEGPDHHFSATPEELKALVKGIREIELALGSSGKKPVEDEIPLREKLQRSLVAVEDIQEGSILIRENLIVKRSKAGGIPPKYLNIVVGRRVKKKILKDEAITWDVI